MQIDGIAADGAFMSHILPISEKLIYKGRTKGFHVVSSLRPATDIFFFFCGSLLNPTQPFISHPKKLG